MTPKFPILIPQTMKSIKKARIAKPRRKPELLKLDMTFEEAVKLALNTPPIRKKAKHISVK